MSENKGDISSRRDGIDSPFHSGERAIQERVGVREKVEPYGRKGIRDYMPEQHRDFFGKLPFLVVGAADVEHRLWAGILTGDPGFMQSPRPTELRVRAAPGFGDPLNNTWHDGSPIGCLGIELHTRRRNRLNGVMALDDDGAAFTLVVDQSFGNCPQYIQAREPRFLRSPSAQRTPRKARHFTAWDDQVAQILRRADTFFIASQYGGGSADRRQGVDVSQRGSPFTWDFQGVAPQFVSQERAIDLGTTKRI